MTMPITESSIAFDLEGGIYLASRDSSGIAHKVPYGQHSAGAHRSGPLACPFCNTPLFVAPDDERARTFCLNVQCHTRLRPILQLQMERLGIDLSVIGAVLYQNLHVLTAQPQGMQSLLNIGLSWPDPEVRAKIMPRLQHLSFTDFLVLSHVPVSAIPYIEDQFFHVRTLADLYESLVYTSSITGPARIAQFAMLVNQPIMTALVQYNHNTLPTWAEISP